MQTSPYYIIEQELKRIEAMKFSPALMEYRKDLVLILNHFQRKQPQRVYQ